MGVRSVRVVIMIGRWSEGSVCTVRHVVFCLVLENKRLCLGRMCDSVPVVGYECTVLCCSGQYKHTIVEGFGVRRVGCSMDRPPVNIRLTQIWLILY